MAAEQASVVERCGFREEWGPGAPLICGREKGHTGVHIDFRPNVSIGFGFTPASDQPVEQAASEENPDSP